MKEKGYSSVLRRSWKRVGPHVARTFYGAYEFFVTEKRPGEFDLTLFAYNKKIGLGVFPTFKKAAQRVLHFIRHEVVKENPTQKFPTKKSGAFRLDAGHVHIGKGLVYCPEARDSKPPVTTHSRVKCGFCGKTIQSATNPMPSFALLLRRKLAQGFPFEKARDMAARELEQAAIFLRGPRKNPIGRPNDLRQTVKNISRSRFFGFPGNEKFSGQDVILLRKEYEKFVEWVNAVISSGGLSPHTTVKTAWKIYRGTYAKNPAHGPVETPRLIYGRASTLSFDRNGRVTQMTSRKTSGPYKGKDFVHDFKPGVKHVGLPRGTEIVTPDGQSWKMRTRTALMVGPKNLWADFQA